MVLYTKQQLIDKVDGFKTYCIESGELPPLAKLDTTFSALYNAINTYFTVGFGAISGEINCLIQFMYCDILRRSTRHEFDNQFNFNISTDYPQGYSDLRNCFHDFSNIMNTTNQAILDACVIDPSTFTVTNDLSDSLAATVPATHDNELEKITTLANWCRDTGSCCDLINLLENRGKLLEIKGTREIAKMIYIDRHILECIRFFNLTSYIPTYYQEGGV